MPLIETLGSSSARGFGRFGKVAGSLGRNSANFATSATAIYQEDPSSPDGLYWMNIGDGRGITQYYIDFTTPDGPWIFVENNMNSLTGDPATDGIFNNGNPSTITPGSSSVLNTNYAGNGRSEIPYTGVLGKNGAGGYAYFLFDSTARALINSELRDTAGETSQNTNCHTYWTASKVAYKRNTGSHTVAYNSNTLCVVELHHGGWSAGNNINSIWQTSPGQNKSPGGGIESNQYGFGNHGVEIAYGGGATDSGSPNIASIWIKL